MNSVALTDDDRRDLVAYLDGELPPDEASRIEARMLADEAYRAEMQSLQASFDLLDDLPISSVRPDFTRTTVEVAIVEARNPTRSPLSARRLVAVAAIGLCVVLAATFGFAWQRNRQLRPEIELIRDFPVIENFDAYREAGDVEFLRDLQQEGLFEEEAGDAWK